MALFSDVPRIHIFAVILGSVEIMLFGGVIFGWHSVVYIYKDTNYFSDLCPLSKPMENFTFPLSSPLPNISLVSNIDSITSIAFTSWTEVPENSTPTVTDMSAQPFEQTTLGSLVMSSSAFSVNNTVSPSNKTGNKESSDTFDNLSCEDKLQIRKEAGGASAVCGPQDEQFNLIFSLATGINGILSFPSGYMYDRLGTRISRIFSIVSFLVGQLCLIFASPANPYLLYPGFAGLVYGGYQILLTNLQLSCLIPSLRSTIMSLYSGSYDTSSSIFLLFKAGYESGVSVNTSFAIQASLYFLIFVSSTFFFLPKSRVPFPPIPGYRLRCFLCHKFCGTKPTPKTFTSGEWKVDANGSVILSTVTPNGGLDTPLGASNASINSKILQSKNLPENQEMISSGDKELDDAIKKEDGEVLLNRNEGTVPVSDDVESECLVQTNNHSNKDQKQSSLLKDGAKQSVENNTNGCDHGNKEKAVDEGETNEERKTFRQVALSPLFLTDLLWISSMRLRSWIFVGMFNPWITRLACGDKQLVSHYTSVYAGLQFFGILTAPLSGRLMDRKIKGAEKYGNPRFERLHASIASFLLNSTVSVVLTVCTLIPVLQLQYVTFALHCLHRSFLYGPNSAFVANAFPHEHFGKLFGVTLTVSALFSMLQYPLFLIMQGPLGGDPLAINVFLLVLMLISYIHPIYIWRYLQNKLRKMSV